MQVKYAWIQEHKHEFSVSTMCGVMDLSRSSYYEWLHRPESDRAKEDKEISVMINEVFSEGRSCYGARRVRKKLAQKKVTVSRRRTPD